MSNPLFHLHLLLLLSLQLRAATITKPLDKSQILLVVSYDSFNKKYFDLGVTPNLKRVADEGISVPYLRNVFTTKTLPNHFSIATGLYPDKHGITNTVIFDKKLGRSIKYGQDFYHFDERVTPIWVSSRSVIFPEQQALNLFSPPDFKREARRAFSVPVLSWK